MKARFTSVLAACALLTSAVGTANGQATSKPGQCYATTGGRGAGMLLWVNTTTGAVDSAKATGTGGLPGLAIDSQGRIFASGRGANADYNLYRIDAATGTADSLGEMVTDMSALAFDANDSLLAASNFGPSRYYSINTANGTVNATLAVMRGNVVGLAFDTLGRLYATAGGDTLDDGTDPPEIWPDEIGYVDPATGEETVLGSLATGIAGTPDIAIDSAGTIYVIKGRGKQGSSPDFRLYTVDPQNNWAADTLESTLGYPASGLACDTRRLGGGPEPPSGEEKVFVCHHGKTLNVHMDALAAHLEHGDTEGACIPGDNGPGRGPNTAGKAELAIPESFNLSQNYPNPFNPTTTISFALPEATSVRLAVYNALGQEVKVLVSSTLEAGTHSVTWNATDHDGQRVSTGLYIYRITAGDLVETRKMLLLE